VSATPTFGTVVLLVSKHNGTVPPPSCNQPAAGAQIQCTGWTWMSTGMAGSSAMYISASNPCNPTTGSGLQPPMVNTSTCAASWRPGRYWAVVYAYVDSDFAVTVQNAGLPTTLADGEPQLVLTSPVAFCTNRDNVTGQCTGSLATFASAGLVTFSMPANLPQGDQYVMVEKICPGGGTGSCGADLHLYARGCPANRCTAMDGYPYWNVNDVDQIVTDSVGSMTFPSCYGTATPGFGASDCIYTVSVMPICGNPQYNPGIGCPPTLFRLTWSGDTSLERVPSDCFSTGRACTLPAETVGGYGQVRRYEAYGSSAALKTVTAVQACTGNINLYLCTWGSATTCDPVSLPGPGNADYTANTASNPNGVATITAMLSGPFFFGISTALGSVTSDPSYVITLYSGSVAMLSLPNNNNALPVVTRSATGTTATVAWELPQIVAKGQQNYVPNNLVFDVYFFPAPVSNLYNLEAACGVAAAYAALRANVLFVSTLGTSVTVAGLNSAQAYTVAVTAMCSGRICMPNGLQTQTVAYLPVGSPPGPGPAPSPSPTTAPPNNNNNNPSGPSPGAVAGGVIGALLGVGLLVGAALYYVRVYRPAHPSAGSGGYEEYRRGINDGGDADTSGLVTSFTAGGGAGASAAEVGGGSEYSQL